MALTAGICWSNFCVNANGKRFFVKGVWPCTTEGVRWVAYEVETGNVCILVNDRVGVVMWYQYKRGL